MRVRDAGPHDLPAITAILNEAIAHTTAVWSEQPVSVEERAGWLAARRAAGFPVLVAQDADEEVAGFASLGEFRPWSGYSPSAELSIYVGVGRRGRGIGRLLLAALVERARRRGTRVLVAGIEASNERSLRLHARAGFLHGGSLPGVGTKFGRELELVLMYLPLTTPAPRARAVAEGIAVGPLEGRLVRLEPLEPAHLPGLRAAAAELPELPFSFVPNDRESTARYLAEALAARDAGSEWPFATRRRNDGAIVGTTRFLGIASWNWPERVGHEPANGLPDSTEIGATWLTPSTWRTGINLEAKLLMLAHAFEVWRVQRVWFSTDARNERSRRAIAALGATFEGLRRAERPAADGTLRDSATFAITASDWPGVRAALARRLADKG